jgi:hypothetical protein
MSVNDAVSRSEESTPPNTVDVDRAEGAERPENPEFSRDQTFHLLQNQRRREVLRYLRNADAERVRMRDIAESIAAAEHETSVDALSSKQRQRVYVPLYQNHLPKLDAEGVLDYDQSRGVVERRPAAAQLERHLWPSAVESDDEQSVERTDSSSHHHWLLTAVGLAAVLFGGATFDVSVLALVPDVIVSGIILCLLVAVTLWTAIDWPGNQTSE